MYNHKKFSNNQSAEPDQIDTLKAMIDSAWDELRERMIMVAVNIWAKAHDRSSELATKYKNDTTASSEGVKAWRPTEARTAWLLNHLGIAPQGSYNPNTFSIRIVKDNRKKFISLAHENEDINNILNSFINYNQYSNLIKKLKQQTEKNNNDEGSQILKCTYCDIKLDWHKKVQSYLDRVGDINNSNSREMSSYGAKDLVLACSKCNRLKGTLPTMEFLDLVKNIYINMWAGSNNNEDAVIKKINSNKEILNNIFGILKKIETNVEEVATNQAVAEAIPPQASDISLDTITAAEGKKRIYKIAKLLSAGSKSSRMHKHSSSKSIRYNKLQEIFKAAQGVLPEAYHADEPDQESAQWDTRDEVADKYKERQKLLRQLAEEEKADHPLEPQDDPSSISDTLRKPFDKDDQDDQDVLDDDIPF